MNKYNLLPKNQRGATLIIALVMLVLLTLFAISAINLSSANLSIVGNMQARLEAQSASEQAIEQIISSAANFTTPAAQDVPIDGNNDGSADPADPADFTAHVAKPACYSSKSLTNANLNPALPKDAVCISSVQDPGTGVWIANASSAQSWCYDQKWEITATVTGGRTGAQVKEHRGVSMRVPAGTACSS